MDLLLGGPLSGSSNSNLWNSQGDGFEHRYRGPSFMPMVNRDSPECMGKVGSGMVKAESSGSKSPEVCSEVVYRMEPPSPRHEGGSMSITKAEDDEEPIKLDPTSDMEFEEKLEGGRDRGSDQLGMYFMSFFCLKKNHENSRILTCGLSF